MMYGVLFSTGFLFSIILLILLFKVRNVAIARYMIAGTLLASLWILTEDISFYTRAIEAAELFFKVKLFCAILIPPLYLLLSGEYVHGKLRNTFIAVLIFIVPAMSLLSLLTGHFPYKFVTDETLSYITNIPVLRYQSHIGFYIHAFYSYALISLCCYFFLMRAIKSPKLYRLQSVFIFFGTITAFLINILVVIRKIGPVSMDVTSVFMLLNLYVIYFGLFVIPKSGLLPKARDLLVENITDIAAILDSSDRIIDINPAAVEFICRHVPYTRKTDIGPHTNFIGIQLGEIFELIPDLRQIESMMGDEAIITLSAGEKAKYYRVYQASIVDREHMQIGKLYMLHDITQMQEYTNNLRHLNDKLLLSDRIINAAMEGILITDASANIVRVNHSFELMSGYLEEDLIGKNPRIMKSDRHDKAFFVNMWDALINNGYWEGEIWDKRKDGEVYPKWMSILALKQRDGTLQNYISISTDISKIKNTEHELHVLANYDSLTGIPNRSLFYEKLEEALVRAGDNKKAVALLFMDLDGFKLINDSLGHAAGDALLKEVAARAKHTLRMSDTLSRVGGDEFTVIIENIEKHEDVMGVAQTLIDRIGEPYEICGQQIMLGVSMGIVVAPHDETTVEGMVRKADAAMYDAKESGRGRYSFSSDEIDRKNKETLVMQMKLKNALENGEFVLYLQPQISMQGNKFEVVGAEALIRWKTKEGVIYTPEKFIPISEVNGMIVPIGNWIIEEIFSIDRELKKNGISLKLSINVSSRQFESDSFFAKIREEFRKNFDQNINLAIEITESFLLLNFDKAIESLLNIKKLGISISLDDFGTGFSSLSYLTKLPLDYLKIDQSFIRDIADANSKNLTSNIISIARTLNLKTVAEGVETEEQVKRLIDEDCDELQGYYFSVPRDIGDFISYVRSI